MSITAESIRPEDFNPLFAFEGIGYLFTQEFLDQYSKHDTLVVYDHGFFRSFISKAGMDRTLAEGTELFSDDQKFEAFFKDWQAYLDRAKVVMEKYSGYSQAITAEDWRVVTDTLKECWKYHDKTEFIFTDSAFLKADGNEAIARNIKRLGELKFPSSEVLHNLGLDIFYRVAENVADQFGVTHEDIKFYGEAEVAGLFGGAKPSDAVIFFRKKAYVLYGAGGKLLEPETEEETLKIVEAFRPNAEATRTLTGMTASKGAAEGVARVILADYGNDFRAVDEYVQAMQGGEILITENTTPQFWPVLRKAAAIITNQGGLNSHAAIVAREMGIPCVVGVASATELLKTGDRLSVDATGRQATITVTSRG